MFVFFWLKCLVPLKYLCWHFSKGSHRAFHLKDNNQVWWRHGIVVNHQDGYFIVESSSAVFADPTGFEGILVTVYSTVGNFSAMGFVADLIDSLIAEWFPGKWGIFGYLSQEGLKPIFKIRGWGLLQKSSLRLPLFALYVAWGINVIVAWWMP